MGTDGTGPLPGWVVRSDVRHERLVWTAAKPRLEKQNRRWWHALYSLGRTADIDEHGFHGSSTDREQLGKGMERSAVVVDHLAPRFSADERERLRLTGRLPDWFWSAYSVEAAADRNRS
jgi:hypothetical protein